MSRSVRMVGAALIPAFALPLANAGVATAAVPPPPTNSNLPSELDIASPYVPQSICDPEAKPGVLAFARLMANHYSEFNYGISRACNYGITEHSEGRALDWMLNAYDSHERAVADSVLSWLMAPDAKGRKGAMARRFGVMYVIWDNRIWGTYAMDEGWRPYNGSNPHTDHIHFSFSWDGAMQRTSWWTGRAWTGVSTAPDGPSVPLTPPDSYPTLREGASGPDVALAQEVIGVTADGIFGPATKSALISWQQRYDVAATGVLDQATWDKMVALGEIPARGDSGDGDETTTTTTIRRGSTGEAVKELQRILGLQVDGIFGSRTDAAVRQFQEDKSLSVDGVVTANVWKALRGQPYTKTGSTSTTIPESVRKGSTGAAVKKLQTILDITADGIFGSGTEAAVKAFQKEKSLTVNGVVDSNVWRALLGMSYTKTGSTSTTIPESVRKGSTGAAVKKLQSILGITADGIFGSGTEAAVKAFQKEKSLKVDGFVTNNVWKALLGMSYVKTGDTTDTTTTQIPETVRKGSTGAAVKKLQSILGISADGIFGSGTEAAVKEFQKEHSLTVDGIVGANTWKALLASDSSGGAQSIGAKIIVAPTAALSTVNTSTEFTALKSLVLAEGSRSVAVRTVQQTVGGVAVDGVFGSATTRAVRSFQSEVGLAPTGIVDESTWAALEEEKHPFLGFRRTVLKPGSTGSAVKALQTHLGLTVDGVYGPSTEAAVRSVQQRHALASTGYVGSVTWQALEREMRVPA